MAAGQSTTTTRPPSTTQVAATSTTLTAATITTTTTRDTTTAPPAAGEAPPPAFNPGDDPVAFAVADLAHRLGVPDSTIALVERHEVVWRDGSLGCPQPGMVYSQALVDGSKIVLEAGGVSYDYHQGGGRPPFLCALAAEG